MRVYIYTFALKKLATKTLSCMFDNKIYLGF